MTKLIHAGGEYQLPFMTAASRALRADPPPCPRCNAELRAYFHIIKPQLAQGSIWVWCGTCHTYTILPRVRVTRSLPDPLADLPDDEFIALETSRDERFFDRIAKRIGKWYRHWTTQCS
jgi:hypothetical protein